MRKILKMNRKMITRDNNTVMFRILKFNGAVSKWLKF